MFLDQIKQKTHAAIDEWQTEMLLRPIQRGDVHLYAPGLSHEERKLTGVHMIESVNQAVRESVHKNNDTRVAIIPEGPYVVPFVKLNQCVDS